MPWSRLKSMVESRLASSLDGRVTLHQARYRHAQEEIGRIWLAVDGDEVAAFATHMGYAGLRPLADSIMDERNAWGSPSAYASARADAEAQLRAAGSFSDSVALGDLEEYLSLTVEAALSSPSPLVRALAMLDRRLGKRRLRELKLTSSEHPFVRSMYALLCVAENVRPAEPDARE